MISKLIAQKKRYDVWDHKLPGFHVRVNTNGRKFFRCLFRQNNQRKYITIGSTELLTVTEAKEKAKIILGMAANGVSPIAELESKKSVHTLKEYIDYEFAPWCETSRKAGKEDIKKIRTNFFDNFGDKKLLDILPLDIERWRSKRLMAGVKPATVNRDIATLKSTLSKAKAWGFITYNPLESIKPIKLDVIGKIRFLEIDEEKRLRKALDQREMQLIEKRKSANEWRRSRGYELFPEDLCDYMKTMILLSINTGLRRGELFDLKWENVDFNRSNLVLGGHITKSGLTRHIPLNKEALSALREWRKNTNSNELVFPNKDAKRLNNVKRSWATILRMADIKNFRWHDMRHHFASRLVMAGVDLNTVRELLGHADIKMTLRYAHLAPEHKARAVEKLVE